jgi:hypothetical protein
VSAAADRVFVPAVFAARLADMPSRATAPAVRVVWLRARLAELAAPGVVGAGHGLEALRLATQVQRELSTLATAGTSVGG